MMLPCLILGLPAHHDLHDHLLGRNKSFCRTTLPDVAQAALHDTAYAPKLQALKDLLAECGIGVEPGKMLRQGWSVSQQSPCRTARRQVCSPS